MSPQEAGLHDLMLQRALERGGIPAFIVEATADVCTWRERGGLTNLVKVPLDPITPGMVRVAKVGDPWREHPELVFQVWPEDLEVVGVQP